MKTTNNTNTGYKVGRGIIKRAVSCGTAAALALTMLAGCQKASESKADGNTEVYKVGIIQHMAHPSLNQINKKIQETLQPLVEEGKVEIVEKNASGDQTMLPTIIKGLLQDGCDMLVPIATPTAQAAAAATSDIPIVFSAVSTPVEAGLVEDFNKTDKNITGVSNAIAIEDIFELAQELTPNAKDFWLCIQYE